MKPEDHAALERESWLASLTPGRRAGIIARLSVHDLAPGSFLYRLGDPPNGMHAILRGQVRLSSYTVNGREVAELIAPVFWLGELSVIDGQDRPHDAIADSPVRVAQLSMTAIRGLTAADPWLWRDIARLGCMHQRMVMSSLSLLQNRSTMQRMAELLLRHALTEPNGIVRMTQEHLAEVVGVSRQHANAMLADLSGRGLLRRAYRRIVVEPTRMQAFVGQLRASGEVAPMQ